jgi:hypothetical protein
MGIIEFSIRVPLEAVYLMDKISCTNLSLILIIRAIIGLKMSKSAKIILVMSL